jgi:hypothetical protein
LKLLAYRSTPQYYDVRFEDRHNMTSLAMGQPDASSWLPGFVIGYRVHAWDRGDPRALLQLAPGATRRQRGHEKYQAAPADSKFQFFGCSVRHSVSAEFGSSAAETQLLAFLFSGTNGGIDSANCNTTVLRFARMHFRGPTLCF